MKICSECHSCYEDTAERCEEMHGPLSETRSGGVSMIPGYRLEERLYSGLRGDLFRATRTDCGRSCLVRVIASDAATGQLFLDEAKLVANLFPPNLTAVYEAGTTDSGEPFAVFEDAAGNVTLRESLDRNGPPDLLESIRIVRLAAEGLHELHLAGIIHRAVSPENILISTGHAGQTSVRLQQVDFGGAAQHAIISNKFLIDSETAAIRYFAPEQCADEPATARSDVYALGILLYELIAGAPPFDADHASGVIEQHRNSRPPEVRIDNLDLRMLVSHTLLESLSKRADLRQASADLFARQLKHIELLATHVSTPPPAVNVVPQPVAPTRAPRMITLSETEIDLPELGYPSGAAEDAYILSADPAHVSKPAETLKESESEIKKIDPDSIKKVDFRAVREQMQDLLAATPEPIHSNPPSEPKLIKWDEPLDDIPSVEETLEVLRVEGDPSASFDAAVAEPPARPSQASTVFVDDGLRNENRPHARASGSTRSGSLIGLDLAGTAPTNFTYDRETDRRTRSASDGEMFASIQSLSAVGFGRLRRGIGLATVAAIIGLAFTFRGDIADAFTPFDLESLDPSYSRTTARSAPAPVQREADATYTPPVENPTTPPALPTVEDPPAAVRISSPESKRGDKTAARDVIKRTSTRSVEAPSTLPAPGPIRPSTVVITYPDPKARTGEKAEDRDPFVQPKNASQMTRPRIVADPKP